MEALEAIRTRRSVKKLIEPAPTAEHLTAMLEAAVLAPDHKELQPWRFVLITEDDREAFGEVLAQGLLTREPGASEGQLDKERAKPMRAPMIVAVAAKRLESKLAFSELVAATSAATQNFLLAAHALGYGAIWRTGAPVGCEHVKGALGFDREDEIVGFIYLGTIDGDAPQPRNAVLDDVVTRWTPPVS